MKLEIGKLYTLSIPGAGYTPSGFSKKRVVVVRNMTVSDSESDANIKTVASFKSGLVFLVLEHGEEFYCSYKIIQEDTKSTEPVIGYVVIEDSSDQDFDEPGGYRYVLWEKKDVS